MLTWRRDIKSRLQELATRARFGATTYTFIIEGWVPRHELAGLRETLAREVGAQLIVDELATEASEREHTPVAFANPTLLKPFEMLVRMLAVPRYGAEIHQVEQQTAATIAQIRAVADDEARSIRERHRRLELLDDATVGLIGVSATLMEQVDEATRRRIDMRYKPVVVTLPTGGPTMGFPSRHAYLAALIQRAIGSQITFPGEGGSTK